MKIVSLIAIAAMVACVPKEPKDDLAIANACHRLRELSCPEGNGSPKGVPCEEVLAKANALRPLPLACWAGAEDAIAARGCGSLRCQ